MKAQADKLQFPSHNEENINNRNQQEKERMESRLSELILQLGYSLIEAENNDNKLVAFEKLCSEVTSCKMNDDFKYIVNELKEKSRRSKIAKDLSQENPENVKTERELIIENKMLTENYQKMEEKYNTCEGFKNSYIYELNQCNNRIADNSNEIPRDYRVSVEIAENDRKECMARLNTASDNYDNLLRKYRIAKDDSETCQMELEEQIKTNTNLLPNLSSPQPALHEEVASNSGQPIGWITWSIIAIVGAFAVNLLKKDNGQNNQPRKKLLPRPAQHLRFSESYDADAYFQRQKMGGPPE